MPLLETLNSTAQFLLEKRFDTAAAALKNIQNDLVFYFRDHPNTYSQKAKAALSNELLKIYNMVLYSNAKDILNIRAKIDDFTKFLSEPEKLLSIPSYSPRFNFGTHSPLAIEIFQTKVETDIKTGRFQL